MPQSLENLSRPELLKLRDNSQLGDVVREKIVALLESAASVPAQKSTDPRDRMNETEKRYALILDLRIRTGDVNRWDFEDVTFRVGLDRCRYTPDFVAELAAGGAEVIEIKGAHIRDDARVKFLSAAKQFPWLNWKMLQWANNEWRTVHDFTAAHPRPE